MDRTPHVYLIPGFLGFANLGRIAYFGHVRPVLATRLAAAGFDARIHVVRTSATASVPRRAARIAATIAATAGDGGGPLHLIGHHSSGGLDAPACSPHRRSHCRRRSTWSDWRRACGASSRSRRRITERRPFSLENTGMEVKKGVVRLTRTVPSGERPLEAAVAARAVPGVRTVKEDLRLEAGRSS